MKQTGDLYVRPKGPGWLLSRDPDQDAPASPVFEYQEQAIQHGLYLVKVLGGRLFCPPTRRDADLDVLQSAY